MVCTLLLFAIAVAGTGATYGWVISLTAAQSLLAGTQVRVELIEWDLDHNRAIVTVRNTGSVDATITSIGMKKMGESGFTTSTENLPTIRIEAKSDIIWDKASLERGTQYVVRVTCSTGFYYETVATTPQA